MGIEKIYNPLLIENKWLVKWEKEDFFKSGLMALGFMSFMGIKL